MWSNEIYLWNLVAGLKWKTFENQTYTYLPLQMTVYLNRESLEIKTYNLWMCSHCLIKYDGSRVFSQEKKKIQVYAHMNISMYMCVYWPVRFLCWLCYFKNRSKARHKDSFYVKKYWKVCCLSNSSYCFFYCRVSLLLGSYWIGGLGINP